MLGRGAGEGDQLLWLADCNALYVLGGRGKSCEGGFPADLLFATAMLSPGSIFAQRGRDVSLGLGGWAFCVGGRGWGWQLSHLHI